MNWIQALKIWNEKNDGWVVPKKGTIGHQEVMTIMKGANLDGSGLKRLGGSGMRQLGSGCDLCSCNSKEEKQIHQMGMGLRRLGYTGYEKPQRGGFFPALLAMLPALSSVLPAIGTALSGAVACNVVDGVSNVVSGKNFFTGKGMCSKNGCYCHMMKNRQLKPYMNKCGVQNGGNILEMLPMLVDGVKNLLKNPMIKKIINTPEFKKATSGVASVLENPQIKMVRQMTGLGISNDKELEAMYQKYLKKK